MMTNTDVSDYEIQSATTLADLEILRDNVLASLEAIRAQIERYVPEETFRSTEYLEWKIRAMDARLHKTRQLRVINRKANSIRRNVRRHRGDDKEEFFFAVTKLVAVLRRMQRDGIVIEEWAKQPLDQVQQWLNDLKIDTNEE
jgi:uncharacterized membrane protein YgaE (UPF0421/DUF939 family)